MINGAEGAGIVAGLGAKVRGIREGDRIAYWNPAIGSYATYAVCPAFRIVQLPDDMDFEIGAALMLQGLTAHYLIRSTFKVSDGHSILFHAGAGGVGQVAIQLAKAQGARVLVTVGSDEKAALPLASGPTQQSCMTKLTLLMQRAKLPGARVFMLSMILSAPPPGKDRSEPSGHAGWLYITAMPPAPFRKWTCPCLLKWVLSTSPALRLKIMCETRLKSSGDQGNCLTSGVTAK